MTWILLLTPTAALLLGFAALVHRRVELRKLSSDVREVAEAKRRGSDAARLQYPHIDWTRCMGCGLCVSACPEEQVLEIIHGQAVIVHGSRCVGHGHCQEVCPVDAISLTLGDLSERRDLPALDERFEAVGRRGIFLAGEITGYALVRTAIAHGTAVADEVARRVQRQGRPTLPGEPLPVDLCIVGAGPAGLACASRARELGLSAVIVEQEDSVGGTVAKYPRRKLVLTQPVTLPGHGPLKRKSYLKEELVELWERVAVEQQLDVRTGLRFEGVAPLEGAFAVRTSGEEVLARNVCLAIGRRGSPRKLGVPGEELPKVCYSLNDASSFRDRRVVVVGGGDSAVEAAVGLAEQPGNEVALSYRKRHFTRIKARNERRLEETVRKGRLELLLESEVTAIERDAVVLRQRDDGAEQSLRIANDDVFILAGGVPPFDLVAAAGVSFDPADRPVEELPGEQGPGLLIALAGAGVTSLIACAWVAWFRDYYTLSAIERLDSPLHDLLRSAGPAGASAGVVACLLMAWNLGYLWRRSRWGRWLPGSLSFWMSSHVLTGILALLAVVVHSALAPRASVGGHALLLLFVVVTAGAIGRYLYSFVPRAANGRELRLGEVQVELAQLSERWERNGSDFGERVRHELGSLLEADRWGASLPTRLVALFSSQRRVRRALDRTLREGRAAGHDPAELDRLIELARQAHSTALAARHFEDLRALLASWRYLHRWLALLLVLIVVLHIVAAVRYADFSWLERGLDGLRGTR